MSGVWYTGEAREVGLRRGRGSGRGRRRGSRSREGRWSGDQRMSLKMRFSSAPPNWSTTKNCRSMAPPLRYLWRIWAMRRPMVALMPSSSSSSRASACSAVSPGSILPPGNSHLRLMGWSGLRWQIRTSVASDSSAWRRMSPATTSRMGLEGPESSFRSSLRIGSFTRLSLV